MSDAIVALATPTGRSGIGVIRLSGNDALSIARKLTNDAAFSPAPRIAYLKQLIDPVDADVIDETIVTFFEGPHSFTGEDVVEISCHGSPVVLRRVIDICLSLDARLADPGEFSLRALANGRMNLAEAEAIRDLIDAQTTAAARQAVRQMSGELSLSLQPVKDDLLDAIVVLESALEFVEDDLPTVENEKLQRKLAQTAEALRAIANTYKSGHLIREGLRVAIVGRPNVGKSSLFNALVGSDRAIITDIAGTTRDQIHERFTIGDIPISLIDTAGLRETTDVVESIGVGRAKATMADSDLVIVMADASEPAAEEDRAIIDSVEGLNFIVAANKVDKMQNRQLACVHSLIETVLISAKTGEGLDDLRAAMIRPFSTDDASSTGFLITDARHYDLFVRAGAELEQSIGQLQEKLSEEIVLIGLHSALRYLGEVTGETTTEDMLTRIFSTFCIGK